MVVAGYLDDVAVQLRSALAWVEWHTMVAYSPRIVLSHTWKNPRNRWYIATHHLPELQPSAPQVSSGQVPLVSSQVYAGTAEQQFVVPSTHQVASQQQALTQQPAAPGVIQVQGNYNAHQPDAPAAAPRETTPAIVVVPHSPDCVYEGANSTPSAGN